MASSSRALGGASRAGRILGPSLDKIVKNVAWRKHSNLVAACKAALDRLETLPTDPESAASFCSSLYGLSAADVDLVIAPLLLALDSGSTKVVEPTLECVQKLFSHGIAQGEIDGESGTVARLVQGVCKCAALDEALELGVLRVLIAVVRSTVVLLRGECLVDVVKCLYNVYLSSRSGVNRVCAKAVLVQILLIVFARVEVDAMEVKITAISIMEILDLSDKSLNDSSIMQFAQSFISDVMEGSEMESSSQFKGREISVKYGDGKSDLGKGGSAEGGNSWGGSKIRDNGLFLFKNLCKFSMKIATQDNQDDQILLRGKVLSLELLKIAIDNAGQIWRTNEKFLGAIKQYLCLSMLKNSALSVMSIFQLLCSIFTSLLSGYRSGLKGEIGIFFPMLVLRVLENVLQPSFLQKLTVLNLLEKIFQDPQIIIDLFVNYDCDVDAPNIFE